VMGAAWTRGGVGWGELEPRPGQFDMGALDAYAATATTLRNSGVRSIVRFGQFPGWVSAYRDFVPPARRPAFRRYVHAVVERLAGIVDHWEVVNEPQRADGYHGNPEDIVAMHRIVFEEVHRLDPGGLVLGPTMNPRRPRIYGEMRALFDRGLADVIDGVSIHTYGKLETAGFVDDLARLRALLAKYGAGRKPVFITEHGVSVPPDLSAERRQARQLVRTNLLAMQAGVRAVVWHMMSWPQGPTAHQRDYAIIRAEPGNSERSPRPAFVAAATLSRILGQARFVRTIDGLGETVVAQVYEREKSPVLVVWDWGHSPRRIEIDVGVAKVAVIDIVGGRRTVRAKDGRIAVEATPDPVYILGAGVQVLED
jgi:hypothetical protein